MRKKKAVTEKQKKAISLRQKRTLEGMAKGKSRRQAMLDAGYSPTYANSGGVKVGESWQELLDKYLPDKKITKAVDSLIKNTETRTYTFSHKLTKKQVYENLLQLGHHKKDCVVFKDSSVKGVAGVPVYTDFWKCYVKVLAGTDVSAGTEKAIKLKDKYAPVRMSVDVSELNKMSDEELNKKIKALEKSIGLERSKQ